MYAWQATVQDEAGNIVPLPVVTVYRANGMTLANIFNEAGTPLPNPFTGTMEGFVQFWVDAGEYKIEGSGTGGLTDLWSINFDTRGIQGYETFVSAVDTEEDKSIFVGGRMYESSTDGPFVSGDNRNWLPLAPDSQGKPLLVLATGQSNMLGHTETSGDRRTLNGLVFVYEHIPSPSQTTGWKCAGPDSPDWPFSPTGNNLAYHFCDALQRSTGRPVYLVMHAAGGQPIAQWMPGGGGVPGATGSMFQALNSAFQAAINAPTPTGGTLSSIGISLADFLLWHQGEADADYKGTTGEQWIGRFRTVLNTLRTGQGTSADPMLQETAPVLVGELLHGGTSGGNATDDRNVEIDLLNRVEPLVASVSSGGLSSPDGLHFSGASLQVFGYRYYKRLGIFPKLVPNEVNVNFTRISGRVVRIRGNGLTVPAATDVTVNLPIKMANSGYVPIFTISSSGTSTPYYPLLGTRTTETFVVRNTGAQNMTISWSILDVSAT